MPLLGVGYVMTLVVRPTVRSIGVPLLIAVSDAMEAVIVSTQGFVISLPYCFLNSEVQGVVRSHWSRWRMVRTVGKNNTKTDSLATNATFISRQNSAEAKVVWHIYIITPRIHLSVCPCVYLELIPSELIHYTIIFCQYYCHPSICLHVGLSQWGERDVPASSKWTRNKRRRLCTMATLVEAKVGRTEDNNTNENNMAMGMMGGTSSGFLANTKEEERPAHLYSSTTSFSNVGPNGNGDFV